MKIHDVIQGTSQWLQLRSGIPTSSNFDRIITPKTFQPSTQCEKYMFSLIAERLMGHPCIEFTSPWMERGSTLESEAVTYYEWQRDSKTTPIGFVTNDDETVGTSPDRFVNDDGLLEIKIPKEATHVGYLIKHQIDADYYPQVQGQLWLTERRWLDLLSYHPEMPAAIVHVERDEKFIRILEALVMQFSRVLEQQYQALVERELQSPRVKQPSPSLSELMKQALKAIDIE